MHLKPAGLRGSRAARAEPCDWSAGAPWHHNNVGGITAGKARHNSSNVRGVTAGKVGHNYSTEEPITTTNKICDVLTRFFGH